MDKQRVQYPRTTQSQREKLFQIWEETGDKGKACREVRVSEGTFYYWRPRFEAGGYETLKEFANHAPKKPNRTSVEIEQEVYITSPKNNDVYTFSITARDKSVQIAFVSLEL